MKKVLNILLIIMLMITSGTVAVDAASTPKLNKTSVTIEKGKTCKLKLKGAKAGKVKWTSKNKKIATVDKGLVTAKKAGSTKIIATYKGEKFVCKIKVSDPAPAQTVEPDTGLVLTVDGTKLDVTWENNESVAALKKLAPITIKMSGYGGFEQTGKFGSTIVSNDVRITTQPGDIVLYNGNQICLYYDENTWEFTRLGKIKGLTDTEIRSLLDKDSVDVTISFDEKQDDQNKTMIVYFSQTERTKGIAEKIAGITGGEICRIEAKIPYTENDLDYYDSSTRATVEQNDLSARPEIKKDISLSGCKTLFLGYPIWWGQAPRIIDTFVESLDLSGITIIPFCTSGSSGIGDSAKRLESLAGAGTWLSGKRFSANATEDAVREWIENVGIGE